MPSFANPYGAEVPRTMSNEELAQAIRLDLASELEAVFLYDAHVMATDDEVAKKVLADIRDEEKEHMGELLVLLQYLNPKEAELFADGAGEVADMFEELGVKSEAAKQVIASVSHTKKA